MSGDRPKKVVSIYSAYGSLKQTWSNEVSAHNEDYIPSPSSGGLLLCPLAEDGLGIRLGGSSSFWKQAPTVAFNRHQHASNRHQHVSNRHKNSPKPGFPKPGWNYSVWVKFWSQISLGQWTKNTTVDRSNQELFLRIIRLYKEESTPEPAQRKALQVWAWDALITRIHGIFAGCTHGNYIWIHGHHLHISSAITKYDDHLSIYASTINSI